MRATTIIILAFALFSLTSVGSFAAPSEKYERLYRESPDFRAAEDALNDAWKRLRPALGKSEWRRLLDDQRQWLKKQESLLADAKGDDISPYLREACERVLKLRDYYRSLSKKEPFGGEIVETGDALAGWRTSLKLGNTECSRIYSLNPPLKFKDIPEANRDLAKKARGVVDFYADSIAISARELGKKAETSSERSEAPQPSDATDEKGAKTEPPRPEIADEKKVDAAPKIAEESPSAAKSESSAPEIADNSKLPDEKPVGEKPTEDASSAATDSQRDEKPAKPATEKRRESSMPKEDAERVLSGLTLRLKKNGDYMEYYVASKEPCLIEGYELDGGALLSADERAKRKYRPRKTRQGAPLYLFSIPAAETVSRIELLTEAGAKSWRLGGD